MVVELCVQNYATYDGLVNGANGVFKTSTSYHNKTIVHNILMTYVDEELRACFGVLNIS